MKNVGFTLMLLALGIAASAQKAQVEKNIKAFSAAADNQNADAVGSFIDENFRAVINGETVMVIDHDTYLNMIDQKKIGGDKRKVKVHEVTVIDNLNAVAKATITGKKAVFRSLFSLAKINGDWKIVQDLVVMELL